MQFEKEFSKILVTRRLPLERLTRNGEFSISVVYLFVPKKQTNKKLIYVEIGKDSEIRAKGGCCVLIHWLAEKG